MATLINGASWGTWSGYPKYAHLTGDVSRSGNTVTLSNLRFWMTFQYNSWGSGYSMPIKICDGASGSTVLSSTAHSWTFSGQTSETITLNNASVSVGAGDTSHTFNVLDDDGSHCAFTVSFAAGYTAPSTPSVTISEIYNNGAKFNVSISSYGSPSSTSGRYIEAAILNQNSYGASYRWSTSSNTTSAAITVNNSSSANPSSFSIQPNTKYYYGGYATNTQLSSSVVTGTFVTKPANPTSATLAVTGTSTATLTIKAPSMGSSATVTAYYKLNSGSYASAGSISSGGTLTKSLTGLTAGTAYTATVYFSNTSGSTGTVTSNSITTYKAPQSPSVSVTATTTDTVTVSGSISSYGVPASSSSRALVVGVSSANGNMNYCREVSVGQGTSGSATLTNSSGYSSHQPLTLSPNTRYYPYVWATNGNVSNSAFTTAVTKAPLPTYVANSLSVGVDSCTFKVSYPADGGFYSKVVRYSTDGGSTYTNTSTKVSTGSATTVSVTINGLSPRTQYSIKLDTTTTAGVTPGSISLPTFTTGGRAYGSVSGKTKQILKGYCSVNGKTKKIKKIYASVNGKTKRVL